ncbi:unnamed protein product [Arctia plantaginis]|nr:unnamed protein product [Arctia plantaginis]
MLNVTQPDEIMNNNDKLLDLDAMKEHPEGMCKCPRVYFPVCATNGVSYSNACVMHCTRFNVTVRRDGPCIEYRRRNNDLAYNITLPQHWVLPNATNHKLIELTLLNIDFEDTEETLKNPTLRRIRLSKALLDFFDKSLCSNADIRVNVLKS